MMILTAASYALIALLLMAMLARTRPYRRLEKPGRVLAASGLVLPQKLLLHGLSPAALGTALVFGRIAGWMPAAPAAPVAAFALAILLMPAHCTLTTEGAAVGEAMFLPWKEFRRATVRDGRLDLRRPSPLGAAGGSARAGGVRLRNLLPVLPAAPRLRPDARAAAGRAEGVGPPGDGDDRLPERLEPAPGALTVGTAKPLTVADVLKQS
jgi:hypothetical protein